MKFSKIHKKCVHVHATPWDKFLEEKKGGGGIITLEDSRCEWLVGTVLTSPERCDDPYTVEQLQPNAQVLIQAMGRSNDLYIYPIEEQQIMEPGEYMVSLDGVIGVLDVIVNTVETTSSTESTHREPSESSDLEMAAHNA